MLNHYFVCTALPNELSVNRVSATRKKIEGEKRFADIVFSLFVTIPPWSCPLLFYGSLKSIPARRKTSRQGMKLPKRKYVGRDLSFSCCRPSPPPLPHPLHRNWIVRAIHLINRENTVNSKRDIKVSCVGGGGS